MNDSDRREPEPLQDPDTWDWEHAQTQPGSAESGISYVVAFDRAEAQAVRAAARQAGLNTIQFIRQAALEAAARAGREQPSR